MRIQTIKVADVEIEKKIIQKKTIAGLFPRIDGSASYSRTIEKQTMYMDSEAFDMSAMFTPIYNTISQLHPNFRFRRQEELPLLPVKQE